MKKILLGIIIGLVVIIGGCVALLGAGVSSVDNAIKEVEKQTYDNNAKVQDIAKNIEWEVKKEAYSQTYDNNTKVQDIAKNIEWEVKKEAYSTKIVGVFENTSEETLDYVQFDYKLIDADGTVIENSFTNETDVAPGEKRKIEILCMKDNFDKYEITAKASAL